MMIHKAVVILVSLSILPSLSQAECATTAAVDCKEVKTEVTRNDDTGTATNAAPTTGASNARHEAATTVNTSNSSRNNKRRAERQFPRFEPADPRDTVLSSEICVYSSATYTYTCR